MACENAWKQRQLQVFFDLMMRKNPPSRGVARYCFGLTKIE
jgi:hypothetical protein